MGRIVTNQEMDSRKRMAAAQSVMTDAMADFIKKREEKDQLTSGEWINVLNHCSARMIGHQLIEEWTDSGERMIVAREGVTLRTTCEMETPVGFFGINADGCQPDCGHEFEIEVEAESIETDDDGTIRPCYSVRCPKCKALLEWPQEWEVVEAT